MKHSLTLPLLGAVFLCCFGNYAKAEDNCTNLESTRWLSGHWQSKSPNTIVDEIWQRHEDGHMTAQGKTTKLNSDEPPFVETLRIIEIAGEIFYLAKPAKTPMPVAFKLEECYPGQLRFTNPDHDFPQIIEYQQTTKNQMVAKVSSETNKGFQITYQRQAANKPDKIETVRRYVEAYNQKDLAAMMKFATKDIHWGIVDGDKVIVETKDRQTLTATLKQHFSRARKSVSTLSGINSYGDFVSAIEKVTSSKDGKNRSQCSLSVYQFEGDLIRFVWYYPAGRCH